MTVPVLKQTVKNMNESKESKTKLMFRMHQTTADVELAFNRLITPTTYTLAYL